LHPIFLVLVCVTLGTFGQISMQVGMGEVGNLGHSGLGGMVLSAVRAILTRPYVTLGILLYAMSAVLWLAVLTMRPVSYVYPMIALTYVFVTLLAWLLLGQQIPVTRWLGVILIVAGVSIVAWR